MGAVELKFSGSFERSSYLKDWQCSYCVTKSESALVGSVYG
ncbi:17498_t:CDS:2, partial [Funneliformis geosporum]